MWCVTGANPTRRDEGRGYCAQEWAKFCGRQTCAEAISKYLHSKKYILKKTFMMSREKWNSEPDLMSRRSRSGDRGKGNWIQRHLSFKKKRNQESADSAEGSPTTNSPLAQENRCASSPLLVMPDDESPPQSPASAMRRPSCIDGVVAVNFMQKKGTHTQKFAMDVLCEENQPWETPVILQTDFDLEKEKGGVG